MNQVSPKMRRAWGGYVHWCAACEELHRLPDGWTFDGNLEEPTFTPSFKHGGMQTVKVDGRWNGKWVRDAAGKPVPRVCHYVLTKGVLNYCNDCTHAFRGPHPMPDLPQHAIDELEARQ